MTIGELGAAAQAGLSLVLVVLNNGILGRIRAQESEPYSVALENPDFVALARAYGCDGMHVDGNTDLNAAVARAYAHRGSPFVLDVHCAPEALAPMSGWDDGFAPLHFS
jgi:thiamine pyrophosphate-dependent acetolactate synthase large subunit-like protein